MGVVPLVANTVGAKNMLQGNRDEFNDTLLHPTHALTSLAWSSQSRTRRGMSAREGMLSWFQYVTLLNVCRKVSKVQ